MNKKQLGQFFTTNYSYILQNLFIKNGVSNIIEPFCGNGDLLNFITKKYNIECFDIEPKHDYIIHRDTLLYPPDYNNKFILTNPPYLARNKSSDKDIFNKYDTNDLYKCFIKEIITNKCIGGIIIIPLNFWSSIRQSDIDLRSSFLNVYDIIKLNIFEENVFSDTSYTICSFQFEQKKKQTKEHIIDIDIYPSKMNINTTLSEKNNYTPGGDIYHLSCSGKYVISRLTKKNKKNTNILVKCIDDNNTNKISLSVVPDNKIIIDNTEKLSNRTYATLTIYPEIDKNKQLALVNKFNDFLNSHRTKYHSLFLTNYRESSDIARKRISFDLVYKIVEHILDSID